VPVDDSARVALVVEPDAAARERAVAALAAEGWRPVAADSLEAAEALAAFEPPARVLLGAGLAEGASRFPGARVDTLPARPVVLVVDDDPWIRRLLRDALAGEADVADVDSGEAALAWLAEHAASAVLTDQRMGGMSGQDLLRLAREAGVSAPFALLTGMDDSPEEPGFAAVLVKPFPLAQARALVARLVAA
jgi:DNA-binding response OmpR family regulator